ncbi:hypothetical protein GYMLUDRAFT_237807 [Collybiopsis luxurians FD-317 M1]|nr:hypothetical protein GYMLUDRAFT_237807 [Collybiopsis luxurians FD-317 M1]
MASTPGHTKLKMAQNAIQAVSTSDIYWSSQAFRTGFQELQDRLLGSEANDPLLSPGHVERLVEEAKKLVSVLQEPERWKAAQIFILGEYLSKARSLAADHDLAASELLATINVINSAMHHIYQHDFYDSCLNVQEDEAAHSFIIQHHLDNVTMNYHLDTIFLHSLMLLFSTKWALSLHKSSVKCRRVVEEYIYQRTPRPGWVISNDFRRHIEACIIQDLSSHQHPLWCTAAILVFYETSDSYNTGIPLRIYDFAKQVSKFIPQLSAEVRESKKFPQILALTEAVICSYRLTQEDQPISDHDVENVALLEQRLSPEVSLPPADLKSAYWSMNLTALSGLIQACCDHRRPAIPTGLLYRLSGCFMPDWETVFSDISLHQKSQVDFAESVLKLVHSPLREQADTASWQFFHSSSAAVWGWSRLWPQIIDIHAVNILIEAINDHKHGPMFEGMLFYEQELLNHCMAVVQENESKSARASGVMVI